MALHLVRHALAADRRSWTLDDRLRPLADAGTQQAHLLASSAALDGRTLVLSSPARRCVDTVGPLARRIGVAVEPVELLFENNGGRALERLREAMRAAPDAAVVACTHGDIVPALLAAFAYEDGLDLPRELPCDVASTWLIGHDADGRATAASYRPVN